MDVSPGKKYHKILDEKYNPNQSSYSYTQEDRYRAEEIPSDDRFSKDPYLSDD